MSDLVKDIKKVLIFIGYAIQAFFMNLFANLVYSFCLILVTVTAYIVIYKVYKNLYIFLVFAVVLIGVNYRLRATLFLKSQIRLNLMFLNFLGGNGDFLRVKLPENCVLRVQKVEQLVKRNGLKIIPNNLSMAITALWIKMEPVEESGDEPKAFELLGQIVKKETLGRNFWVTVRYFLLQWGALAALFIPFALISYLYTFGMAVNFRFFILTLGFLFVYFLNTAILVPIVSLMIQKRTYS